MRALLADAARTLVPPKGDRHGPLPPLVLALTAVTGLVDAVSYLGLGNVFVANMTGNVVFLGFAVTGADGPSATAAAVSLAAFLAGALAGGRFAVRFAAHRGRLLASAMAVQAALFAAAFAIALFATAGARGEVGVAVQCTLIVLLALAMGLQNAVARRLGVPDLTTTVLTLTLTGLAADSGPAGGAAPRPGRRILSVLTMLLGALLGAVLLKVGLWLVLGVALTLLVTGAVVVWRLSAPGAVWATAP
ncbi:YoaK family protein [Streptomyces sp. NPDC000594]|uniref:YoaK family protein n=1 Tax=Streptomyces sp. NPDC000594 TaxID=3154261 RepID=UPI003328AD24